MLNSQGPLATSGSKNNETLLRAPQDASVQVHNNTVDTSCRAPSTVARNPHGRPTESSWSGSHLQACSPTVNNNNNNNSCCSPALVSPALTSTYIMLPSSTPGNHSQHYPTPHQQPYQQQRLYSEPIIHAYPDPALVDTVDERPAKPEIKTPTSEPIYNNTRRQKKIIWIGIIITIILLGVVTGLVVAPKNKDNDSATEGRVSAPPLPSPMPEKNKCPTFFCHDYYWTTCTGACKGDSVYQSCKRGCNGAFFCEQDCEKGEKCFDVCFKNLAICNGVCLAR